MSAEKSPITCHVLDSTLGKPAQNLGVWLEKLDVQSESFSSLAEGVTDVDGRCLNLLPPSPRLEAGVYKIIFRTGHYFAASNRSTLYPVVEITFNLESPQEHYHIPLLLSPWSYTTYRGS